MADPFIGEIRMFAGTFAPRGWALCDGQVLAISQNTALFSLFGTIYGGDGRMTFALPDCRGRVPVHQGNRPGLTSRALGAKGGSEEEPLTQEQLPAHSHVALGTTDSGLEPNPGGNVLATSTIFTPYAVAGPNVALATTAIGDAGGGQPHANVQPFLCVNFIVALTGVFPSRN
jgi:microcystin-dependent protein